MEVKARCPLGSVVGEKASDAPGGASELRGDLIVREALLGQNNELVADWNGDGSWHGGSSTGGS
jgi:hypothetical protein